VNEMRGLKESLDSQSLFSGKRAHSRIVEIDSWMPNEIHAIPQTTGRLMRLIEGSRCVQGTEGNIELALREALGNAVVHSNNADPKTKVHIRCRCGPGNEISIVVTHQEKAFEFGKTSDNSPTSEPAGKHVPSS
jgi:hypothetical protein